MRARRVENERTNERTRVRPFCREGTRLWCARAVLRTNERTNERHRPRRAARRSRARVVFVMSASSGDVEEERLFGIRVHLVPELEHLLEEKHVTEL